MNEVDKFFEGIPKDAATILEPVAEEKKDLPEEGESHKNRRHRRLEEQLQRERESNIALNERVKTLAEVAKISKESNGEIDPRLLRAFGTSEEGKEATKIFSEVLQEMTEKAKAEALEEFENKQVEAQKQEKEYESFIDAQLENLEDEHNIDLTSDSPQARKTRREFLELVQDLSPKDESGTITGYADFESTFDVYQKTLPKSTDSTNRAKEIASRSMQRSGQDTSSATQQYTPGFHGWKRDFNIEE